jgi:hypothetical protein
MGKSYTLERSLVFVMFGVKVKKDGYIYVPTHLRYLRVNTAHKGMLRIYSNPDPHGSSFSKGMWMNYSNPDHHGHFGVMVTLHLSRSTSWDFINIPMTQR